MIEELQVKMIKRMIERGYKPEFAIRCFEQIKGFGEYGFPESHAASFALLVYVSSYIKCHYPAVFCCALLNSQPMGFYAPAQIVRDAKEHNVECRPVDINHSHWDNTLEPSSASNGGWAVRLGFRQVKGLSQAQMQRLVDHRGASYPSIAALHQRASLRVDQLENLAKADAFGSINRDRRSALWDIKALPVTPELPLFTAARASSNHQDQAVALPRLTASEEVVDDYQSLRLSLKAHPLSFLRQRLQSLGAEPHIALRGMRDKQLVSIAGMAIVRQRPGSAKGVVFMTLEDETGIANVVVWPKVLDEYRPVVMGARLTLIRGKVQRAGGIIHVVADHLEDISHELMQLSDAEEGVQGPLARADEVVKPVPDVLAPTGRYTQPSRAAIDMLVQRSYGDVVGRTMPRFNPNKYPRDLTGLVPKSGA